MAMYKCSDCGCETQNEKNIWSVDNTRIVLTVHRCDACQTRFDLELDFQSEGETYDEAALICPWCQLTYDPCDALEFEDGEETEVECQFCGKHFDLAIRTRRTYSTMRSLCDMPDDYGREED